MGVLPLTFKEGDDADSLGLTGKEIFDIPISDDVKALQEITISAKKEDGSTVNFQADVRLDTPVEVEYYRNGGILHTVLRNLAQ
ncbi:MAG: Aconitate hydratase A [Methanobacteriota archaeon]|nr:MAG: Aconitate hydratase A [Euryarchaeota archaeon]